MRVIITGASGLVATELTTELLKNKDHSLYLISTHSENVKSRYEEDRTRVKCFTLDTFTEFIRGGDEVFDICIHTAFARSGRAELIVNSLDYQRKLLSLFTASNLKTFVNISSQSVYGKIAAPLWGEDTPLAPDYIYAMGKYSSEIITEMSLANSGIFWANIRLCSVCEYARFVRVFVQNAINGLPIHLTAPNQVLSFIDVRDVAYALEKVILNPQPLANIHIFNLGANFQNTIKSIALLVKEVGENQYHTPEVIITEEAGNNSTVGMDASLFMETFHWSPQYTMDDMVTSFFEMYARDDGAYPTSFKLVCYGK